FTEVSHKVHTFKLLGNFLGEQLGCNVVMIGRLAGQFAKPRSSFTEKRWKGGVEVILPSYFGDLVNGEGFTPSSRNPDPLRLKRAYEAARATLGWLRSLQLIEAPSCMGGELGFPVDWTKVARMDFLVNPMVFTSHEALHLGYEQSLLRFEKGKAFLSSTHLPWIGERTRSVDGAHVRFVANVENPIGVKIGPYATPDEVLALSEVLNPENVPGKLILISRMGRGMVRLALPPILRLLRRHRRSCIWLCDPMHGNTTTGGGGRKTRRFEHIVQELLETLDIHREEGTRLSGLHLEVASKPVAECIGGRFGIGPGDLEKGYESACDPRLHPLQAFELIEVFASAWKAKRWC
ncbi:MAG: 3-deoxy-7-phosphoheptulonate synthase, partial [Deltaproteobacteria bacterium]|nr:3-deoxy-7-phosphoheptulonate synthase [Deltaproteobacteria bacterium]